MLARLLHILVSNPAVYNMCQHTIGAGRVTQRIAQHVPEGYSRALDIGAGSGYVRRMWPAEADYFSLDIDRAMLRAGHHTLAIQSDATELPIRDGSMDIVLCKQVSHHISEDRLDHLFSEVRRVLRPGGCFLFMDAVRTGSAVSNLLWRYDRGAHPRAEVDLLPRLERCFKVVHREAHWNLHLYVLLVLAPPGSPEPTAAGSSTGATTMPVKADR